MQANSSHEAWMGPNEADWIKELEKDAQTVSERLFQGRHHRHLSQGEIRQMVDYADQIVPWLQEKYGAAASQLASYGHVALQNRLQKEVHSYRECGRIFREMLQNSRQHEQYRADLVRETNEYCSNLAKQTQARRQASMDRQNEAFGRYIRDETLLFVCWNCSGTFTSLYRPAPCPYCASSNA